MSHLLSALKHIVDTTPDLPSLTDPAARWAFYLSLAERLQAYGELTQLQLYQSGSARAELALWIEGAWVSGPDLSVWSAEKYDTARRFSVNDVDKLSIAATWSGVLPDRLSQARERWQQHLGDTLVEYVRQPAKAFDEHSLLGRLRQADEDGWDLGQIWFHETESTNVPGILDQGFLLSNVKARSRDTHMPDGVFVKPTRETIDVSHDPVQLPILLKKGTVAVFEHREELEAIMSADPAYQALAGQLASVNDLYDDQCEVLLKQPNTAASRAEYDRVLETWRAEINPLAAEMRQCVVKHFTSQGVDQLEIRQDVGSHGRTVHTRISLSPQDVQVAVQVGRLHKVATLYPDSDTWIDQADALVDLHRTQASLLTQAQWCRQAQQVAPQVSSAHLALMYERGDQVAPLISQTAKQQVQHHPLVEPSPVAHLEPVPESIPALRQRR